MALYQIVQEIIDSTDLSNPFVNVYTYDVSDILPSSLVALALADAFRSQVLTGTDGWEDIVRATSSTERLVVTSPFDPTVLGINTTPVAGNRPAPSMPRFVAWGFKSERTRADIRAGFKRFGRVAEGDTNGDVPTGTFQAVLDGFADKLSAELLVDAVGTEYGAAPVIVKRIKYTTEGGSEAYRLPNSPLEYQFMVASYSFQAITTQNSRKA